jgi:iron complex transport system substrate-binding protein
MAYLPTRGRWHRGALFATLILLFAFRAAAAPHRVVSTFLCTDEYVFRLVPRDRIAALSFEAGDRQPVVSTIADQVEGIHQIRPSTESVLALKPDLVVMYAGTNPRLHTNLQALGIAILDVPWANSFADIRRTTLMLGDRLGAPDKARSLLGEMDRTIAQAKAGAPRPPVRALIYEPNGYVAGSSGVTREAMVTGGLSDAAPALRPSRLGTLPVEAIVASAPELLVLSGNARDRRSRADLVLHHPALAALKHTHIAWASTNPVLCPGPWSAQQALTFAGLAREARALAKAGPGK